VAAKDAAGLTCFGATPYGDWVSRTALYLALVSIGCGAVTAPQGPPEIATQYLYFKHGENYDRGDGAEVPADPNASGGLGRLFVEVANNPHGRAMVRFAEDSSGGVGDGWRATVWMALLAAATALEVDPASLRVTVEAEGNVDGPSAGAIMAATIIAAARGETALDTVAMTGTVNADLTIGPVGGLPEKVDAAIDAGKKTIGVPVGQTTAISNRTRQPVNLIEHAKSRGAKVIPIRDVREAYALLTGHPLPGERPLRPDEMDLPEWANDVFARRARESMLQVASEQTGFDKLLARLKDHPARQEAAAVRRLLGHSQRWLQAGEPIAAMWAASEAYRRHHTLRSRTLTELGAQVGEWAKLRDLLTTMRRSLHTMLGRTMVQWKKLVPWQAVEVPMVADTFESFIHTLRALALGSALLGRTQSLKRLLNEQEYAPQTQAERDELVEAMNSYTALMIGAQTRLIDGLAHLEMSTLAFERGGPRPNSPIPNAILMKVAARYNRVADANLTYVDALLVAPLAEQFRKPMAQVRQRLMDDSEDYRTAFFNRHLPAVLSSKVLGLRERSYANLTGSVSSYFASAILISKRYSLDALYDASGSIVGVRRVDAFESMVALADRQTRMIAAQCVEELGEIPLATRVGYRLARELETTGRTTQKKRQAGGFAMRAAALTQFWRASTWGRVALSTHRQLLQGQQPAASGPMTSIGRQER
jgi:uncharacterized protein